MGPQGRLFAFLCAAQMTCLAAGLWVHDRLIGAILTVPAPVEPSWQAWEPTILGVVSFLWIGGLQGVFAWLLLHRVRGQQTRRELQSQEEALLTAKELVRTRDAVIFGLAKLAESRDPDTGHHLERIALYATRLAYALRRHPEYRSQVSLGFVRMIGVSSALHDIGKVGIEDSILLKPGRLTDDERARIQVHASLGGDCIRQIEQQLGKSANFLEMAREIAYFHHERWDGAGYPYGLRGEQIPLSARIVSIADAYDAMAVKRVYKAPYPHDECVDRLRQEAGRQFDPDLIEVFLSIEQQFREIAQSFLESRGFSQSQGCTETIPFAESEIDPSSSQPADVTCGA